MVQPVDRPARVGRPALERRHVHPTIRRQLRRRVGDVSDSAKFPVLIGNDCSPVQSSEEALAKQVGLVGIARLVSPRQHIEVASGILSSRNQRKRLGDQRCGGADQLLVVSTGQEVLTILVRLPRRVEDSGNKARRGGREECPESARPVKPVEGRSPPDADLVSVVAGTPVGAGVARQPVGALEQAPLGSRVTVGKQIVVVNSLQRQHAIDRSRIVDQRERSDMVHEQQELCGKVHQLLAEVVVGSRPERQPHNVRRPRHQIAQHRVLLPAIERIGRLRQPQHGTALRIADDGSHSLLRTGAIEPERA